MQRADTANSGEERAGDVRTALSKAWKYIVPFAFVLYLFNAIDRFNLGFAVLRMRETIQMSPVDYGNVVSAFFLSYLVFQIPANMIIQKIGARRWIGSIVIGWSLCTLGMFVVTSVTQILWLRVALGVFEAGFFPGMIYYLSLWFPGSERARVTACFMLATAVASVIAGPVSGWIVEHFSLFGHAGWRWLFVIEGAPSILLGLLCFFVLSDTPDRAPWLKRGEREGLTAVLAEERARVAAQGRSGFREVVTNPVLWKLALIYMCVQGASQTAQLWLPSIMKNYGLGLSDTNIGLIFGATAIFGAIAMPLWGMSSDRTGERKWHTVATMGITALAFLLLAAMPSLAGVVVALILYGIGAYGYFGTYWSMPPLMLSPAGLAVSVAFINSCSSLGGYLAGKILGYADQAYGPRGILVAMAVMSFLSVAVLLSLRVPHERPAAARSRT